jgi:tetratricopeptide (TPR) repeat protein
MVNVNVTLFNALYSAIRADLPPRDPPLTHMYSRILREAERGVYMAPQRISLDFLEHILPFLAYYPPFSGRIFPPENYLTALPDLEKAAILNEDSVLAAYFMGTVYEHTGQPEKAQFQYSQVWEAFPESYPAALGLSRILYAQGRQQEAIQFLDNLSTEIPDNISIKRQLAIFYYQARDWPRAETAVAEILRENSRDGDFVLMRAHILVEQGSLLQARAPLEIYAGINPTNTLYLFLHARIQNEFYNNRESALGHLRHVLRISSPADAIYNEAAIYAARLMMRSPRREEQLEGRDLLTRLLSVPNPSHDVISLALSDAILREDWALARTYLTRLLGERRSSEDLLAAFTIENAQGNNAAALSFARELYERDRTNEEGIFTFISALISSGQNDAAIRMIESRLSELEGGVLRSDYLYLRSRTRTNEEMILSDLRASLFENPRNINALIMSFEIHHRRNDERRAVFYLRQALALAPDNPRLRRYEAEYNL